MNLLNDFLRVVEDLRGNGLGDADADRLMDRASGVIEVYSNINI